MKHQQQLPRMLALHCMFSYRVRANEWQNELAKFWRAQHGSVHWPLRTGTALDRACTVGRRPRVAGRGRTARYDFPVSSTHVRRVTTARVLVDSIVRRINDSGQQTIDIRSSCTLLTASLNSKYYPSVKYITHCLINLSKHHRRCRQDWRADFVESLYSPNCGSKYTNK